MSKERKSYTGEAVFSLLLGLGFVFAGGKVAIESGDALMFFVTETIGGLLVAAAIDRLRRNSLGSVASMGDFDEEEERTDQADFHRNG